MTQVRGKQLIVIGVVLVMGMVAVDVRYLFPRVQIAKNTHTVTHGQPKPAPEYGPAFGKPGCKRACGGGGVIIIGS